MALKAINIKNGTYISLLEQFYGEDYESSYFSRPTNTKELYNTENDLHTRLGREYIFGKSMTHSKWYSAFKAGNNYTKDMKAYEEEYGALNNIK